MKNIQKLLMLAITLIIVAAVSSCEDDFLPGISGDGDIVETRVFLEEFDGISNATEADIFLEQGDEQDVIIFAQNNILENLELEVKGGTWNIRHNKMVRNLKHVKIYITLPDIDKIFITGSGDLIVENEFKNLRNLDIKQTGSGNIFFNGEIRNLDIEISGSGDATIEGKTESIEALLSGSGSLYGYDMDVEKVDISLTGSGEARIHVADYLKAFISGSGSVYYKGSPEIESRLTGSGSVINDN